MVSVFGLEVDTLKVAWLAVQVALAFFAYKFAVHALNARFTSRLKKHESFFIRKALHFLFILFSIYAVLRAFDVKVSDLVFSTTLLAAAVTLSASTFIGNLLAGIYVGVAKPFQYGDTVKIGNYVGKVHDIGFMSTKLLTWEREVITFPSTTLITQPVVNYDFKESAVRENFEVKVSNEANLEKVQGLLKQAVVEAAKGNKSLVLEEGHYFVQVSGITGGVVTLLLVFTVDEYRNTFRAASDLKFKVWELFKKHKIALK